MPLWSKGRCSLLKSNLKGRTLPDTGEHAAASSWPLFVALELNVILPGKADYLRGGISEPVPLDMMTSPPLLGLLYEVTAGQPARQVLVEDLPFKNSATASGYVPLTYKGITFPC